MFEIQSELRTIRRQQDLIIRILFSLVKGEERMSVELDDLTAAVAQNASVESSAVQLIHGLAAQIANAVAANDGPALAALSKSLTDSSSALAAAVAANTPAAPSAPVAVQAAPVVVEAAPAAPVAADPAPAAPAVDPAAPTA